jgi:hypothetical protein
MSSWNTENVVHTVNPNGNTIAFPSNDYRIPLADCIEILHRANHELMRWYEVDVDVHPVLLEMEEEEDGDCDQ